MPVEHTEDLHGQSILVMSRVSLLNEGTATLLSDLARLTLQSNIMNAFYVR